MSPETAAGKMAPDSASGSFSAAKCAPSVVNLAADTAGEKTGAQQILNRDLKAES